MSRQGSTVKDVPAQQFVAALAAHFKKTQKLELPVWADLIKTATWKELAPYSDDWYYTRAASMARKIYLRGGLGVGNFTRIYGGRARRGTKKNRFAAANKGLHRHILQQLAASKIIASREERKGRWITQEGQRELDTIAAQFKRGGN